ncbi:hypothetical protein SDJN02_20387, partial [Cucurbita argyrosperma subsp. argyrosperma]
MSEDADNRSFCPTTVKSFRVLAAEQRFSRITISIRKSSDSAF